MAVKDSHTVPVHQVNSLFHCFTFYTIFRVTDFRCFFFVGHVFHFMRHKPISDANLCSHIWSVCYLSQSIYDSALMNAEPCTRRCPVGIRSFRNNRFLYRQTVGFDIPMGQHTPMK